MYALLSVLNVPRKVLVARIYILVFYCLVPRLTFLQKLEDFRRSLDIDLRKCFVLFLLVLEDQRAAEKYGQIQVRKLLLLFFYKVSCFLVDLFVLQFNI